MKNKFVTLNFLHDEINGRLHAYLNGECLSAESRVLFPFLEKNINNFNRLLYSKNSANLVELIQEYHNYSNKHFAKSEKLIKRYENKKWLSDEEYTLILSCLCIELKNALNKNNQKRKKTKLKLRTYNSWEKLCNDQRTDIIKKMRKKLESYRNYFYRIILHGSCSTLDYTFFSDIDLILVVKDCIIESPKKIAKLMRIVVKSRKYLDLFNPYNHHGFMILFETELDFFRETYLPLSTLEYGTFLCDSRDVTISISTTYDENIENKKERLIKKYKYIKALEPKNLYHAFDKISSFLLTPSLYFSIIGKAVYKRDSFRELYKIIGEEEKNYLKDIEKIRLEWPFYSKWGYLFRKLLFIFINPLIYKAIIMYILINPIIINKYQKTFNKINRLCDYGIERVNILKK